ncbi:hypothetical protein GCM10010278_04510 [Streptomyces melanogenes]|nr:hypothetical protein GCM10010278_04510 [Streptomyces melanogenes]
MPPIPVPATTVAASAARRVCRRPMRWIAMVPPHGVYVSAHARRAHHHTARDRVRSAQRNTAWAGGGADATLKCGRSNGR